MHYVKQFDINGVATKQVACIELHGKPNAATEGYVGVLGIDVVSPLHEVYKCVAVNGSIYSWELLSSGLSIMSTTLASGGVSSMQFPYDVINKPTTYVIKRGDLLLDKEGYLYQIDALNTTYCDASYTGTQIALYGKSAYDLAVKNGYKGSEGDWLESLKGFSAYELAVLDGYEGSEEEWIASLKGEQGKQGIQGIQGEPGYTPYVGANGNWWIAGIDTGVNADKGVSVDCNYYNGTNTSSLELTFPFVPRIIFIFENVRYYSANTNKGSIALGIVVPEKGLILRHESDNGTTGFTVNASGVSVSLEGMTVKLQSNGASSISMPEIFNTKSLATTSGNYPTATEANGYGYWYVAFGTGELIYTGDLSDIETALDSIMETQNTYIGE